MKEEERRGVDQPTVLLLPSPSPHPFLFSLPLLFLSLGLVILNRSLLIYIYIKYNNFLQQYTHARRYTQGAQGTQDTQDSQDTQDTQEIRVELTRRESLRARMRLRGTVSVLRPLRALRVLRVHTSAQRAARKLHTFILRRDALSPYPPPPSASCCASCASHASARRLSSNDLWSPRMVRMLRSTLRIMEDLKRFNFGPFFCSKNCIRWRSVAARKPRRG